MVLTPLSGNIQIDMVAATPSIYLSMMISGSSLTLAMPVGKGILDMVMSLILSSTKQKLTSIST